MTTIDRHTDDTSKLTAITVPQYGTIRYEMLHVFFTCAQKPTQVSFIYRTEPTTKKWK